MLRLNKNVEICKSLVSGSRFDDQIEGKYSLEDAGPGWEGDGGLTMVVNMK